MDDTDSRIRVLHVDDDPDLADVVSTFLERGSDRVTVETAHDAARGLERLTAGEFDCVVSDYDMPGRNGIEFLETVRDEYPDLPFILYTGKGSEEVASEAISVGVTEYLQKESGTGQYAVLANRIRNAVEKHRAEREREAMRERMELALEHTDSVIYEIDLDSGGVHRLGEFEQFFDHPAAELPTWEDHLERAVHPDDREAFRRFHLELVDGDRDGGTLEYRTNPEDGGVRWIRDDIRVEDGDSRQAVGLAQDITEQRRHARRLETLVDNLPGMVYRCRNEPDWPMEQVAGEAEPLTGYTASEIESSDGLYGAEIVHPEDHERVWRAVQEALEEGESFELTYRIRTRDGTTKRVWERGRGIDTGSDSDEVGVIEGFVTEAASGEKTE